MFLAFQPHLYEQQRRIERQAATAKPIAAPSSSSATTPKAPSFSPSASSSSPTTTPSASTINRGSSSSSSAMFEERRQDDFAGGGMGSMTTTAFKPTGPSPSLFKKIDRKRAATIVNNNDDSNPLNRKQSNTSLKPLEKKLGRTRRPGSARPASSGSGLDEGSRAGRFFSIIPPLKVANGFAAGLNAQPMMKDDTRGSPVRTGEAQQQHHQKKPSLSGGMHVSISLHSPGEKPKASPARASALDGLGISHYIDSFPTTEEEFTFAGESQDTSHYPLPIRLGLMRLGQFPPSTRRKMCRANKAYPAIQPPVQPYRKKTIPQYCHGYYLCTPPPAQMLEKSVTSPDVLQGAELQSADSKDSSHRPSPSTSTNGRGRSMSEVGEAREMSRGMSFRGAATHSNNSEHSRRWKLEQYFRTYSRKTASGTQTYKFHAYDRDEACYWWGYNVKTLIAETLNHSIITATAGLTVLDWSKGPPLRVLDIGTGTGAWVVDSARKWPETEFIGLDLVPVQTPLHHLPNEDGEDLQRRISWVVANALQGLPFPDNSFDFVHIRKLNMGCPEDKWADVLSEVMRVLTPGGSLEIFETDWTFMGSPKEILTSDLQELLQSKGRWNSNKMKMWKHKDQNKFDNLGVAVNAMLKIRTIKFDPASLIPFHLTTLEAGHIYQGLPRHFPILARSSTYKPPESKSKKEGDQDEAGDKDENKENATTEEDEDNLVAEEKQQSPKSVPWSPEGPSTAMSFTMRPQIGPPLPPHRFQIDNQDIFRMAMLVSDVIRVSEARDMIWEDLQRGTRTKDLSSMSTTEVDAISSKNNEDGTSVEADTAAPSVKGPWKHKGEFEKEMDEWYSDLIDRADLEMLLKNTLTWDEAATRMDNRLQADRENRREKKRRVLPIVPATSTEESVSQDETVTPLPDVRRLSEASDGFEEEDRSTIHDHTPAPLPYDLTTPILAFRTTTVFGANKRL